MSHRTHKRICQIVPRLPPNVDGVGDYALSLARQLQLDFCIDSHFLVADPAWQGSSEIEGFRVTKVACQSAIAFTAQLAEDFHEIPILLHYVGYGYAKRGCPIWLVSGLDGLKHQRKHVHLVTMFHEISASGPVWTSAFWLSALQKSLAKRLVWLSDRILTSKQGYADVLKLFLKDKFERIPTLPVFSTVGELFEPRSLASRNRRLVVFGGRSKRLPIYQKFQAQLQQVCQFLDIEEIYDIGPTLNLQHGPISNVPVVVVGILSSYEVSKILSEAIAGFFNYNLAYLSKSTIFAAFCAHGILPISAQTGTSLEDGILPGIHYATPEQYQAGASELGSMQAIADNGHAWYQTHNLSTQAQVYHTLLSNLKTL